MNSDTIKKYISFIVIVVAAVAVGFFAGRWWTKRTVPPAPATGSGTRVMTQQEVQDALRELSAPGTGATRPMTQQEINQALKSLGAPSK